MNKLAIALMAGAAALLATAASAAPLSNGITTLPDGNFEQVRMVCNENGRCWQERSQRRVIVCDAYGYAPRGRHYDRPRLRHRSGLGIHAPGVSTGIGFGRY